MLIMIPVRAVPTPKPRPDYTLIKALVRAHRWRRRIESGNAPSLSRRSDPRQHWHRALRP
jgi:hypothetical protein